MWMLIAGVDGRTLMHVEVGTEEIFDTVEASPSRQIDVW